ncbi:hypothetical protein [Nonomuraea sp. NPDC049758]|uniref:hypothetical protein n=1 Tax=Nonomuraea sp. NPDC049758 TaxID=3154360 RepID=UPI003418641C
MPRGDGQQAEVAQQGGLDRSLSRTGSSVICRSSSSPRSARKASAEPEPREHPQLRAPELHPDLLQARRQGRPEASAVVEGDEVRRLLGEVL